MNKKYLNRAETVQFLITLGLPLSIATLQKYATIGGGPRYSIFGGRAVYRVDHLEEWIDRTLGESCETTTERDVRL